MNYKIISKFIKDVSFEIPDTQAFIMLEKEISNYSLNFDIKSKTFKENIIEVTTILKISQAFINQELLSCMQVITISLVKRHQNRYWKIT